MSVILSWDREGNYLYSKDNEYIDNCYAYTPITFWDYPENVSFSVFKPSVKVVSITPDAESTIAYCARVSNPKNQENENIAGLLKYCANHGHWSIFEMANMVVEINTTRAIAAQVLRHRSFSFQEFSQRYSDVGELTKHVYVSDYRKQDTKNRQNSLDDFSDTDKALFRLSEAVAVKDALARYELLLKDGVAKECARNVLPMSIPTRLYMNGTIRSWIHYLKLRSGNGTQLEHKLIADLIIKKFCENLPVVAQAVGLVR